MGLEDREWWRQAQKERARRAQQASSARSPFQRAGNGISGGLKWGPLAIVVFWLAVMGLLYLAMNHYLKPKAVVVSASGDLIIPRARDGHFYAEGLVNGRPVRFLVDTGATLVTVSEAFAQEAGLAPGTQTVFKTANGDLPGRIVPGVSVSVGPIDVSGMKIGVGLVGHEAQVALLGQNFLAKFEVSLIGEQMVLRKR